MPKPKNAVEIFVAETRTLLAKELQPEDKVDRVAWETATKNLKIITDGIAEIEASRFPLFSIPTKAPSIMGL